MVQLPLASPLISKRQRPVQSSPGPGKRTRRAERARPAAAKRAQGLGLGSREGVPGRCPSATTVADTALTPRIFNQPHLSPSLPNVFPTSCRARLRWPWRLKPSRSCHLEDQKFRTLRRLGVQPPGSVVLSCSKRQRPSLHGARGGLCGNEPGCPQGEMRPGVFCVLGKAWIVKERSLGRE